MKLAPGTRLGNYEILEPIGAGGMGEVYRAKDVELKRSVAIKVLPESLAQDRERVSRFQREARMLASLSHPNIGAIHNLLREADVLFLVLELVEGETLADRMGRGPLPVREALLLFRQVASALEEAHGRGIVHRDLKPDNVKVNAKDEVKVLDFGLAKEFLEEPRAASTRETETGPMTRDGFVLGTPSYMSPEQARAQTVNNRTDIWAFGVCLFEALSGRHPFRGQTYSDVLAKVIQSEPDYGLLPQGVPPRIVGLLRRCLHKDLHQRLHDIGDARLEIEEALESGPISEPPPKLVSGRWTAAAVFAAFLVGAGLARLLPSTPAPHPEVIRFESAAEPTEPVALGDASLPLSISPSGTRFLYAAHRGEMTELRLHAMERLGLVKIPGFSRVQGVFFGPQDDAFGVFSEGKLFRMSLGDPSPQLLTEAPNPRGASWGFDRILFAPGPGTGLMSFSFADRTTRGVTSLSAEAGELSHRWPSLLPDGSHALFTSLNNDHRFDVEVVALDSGARELLIEDGSSPRYAPGHLVFARDSALWAAPFDLERLEVRGDPIVIEEGIQYDSQTGLAFYDLSSDGTLLFAPQQEDLSGEVQGRSIIVTPRGEKRLLTSMPGGYQAPRVSPNGREILMTMTDEDGSDLWIVDRERGSRTRVTSDGNDAAGIWHPDGERITFSGGVGDTFNLHMKSKSITTPRERVTESPNVQFPNSWSPDGKTLVYTELSPDTAFDLWLWHAETGKSEPFLKTDFDESAAVFSPDGRYLAYVSNLSGRDEVYVVAYPGRDKSWTLSSEGGREPVWSRDGSELFYRDGEWMVSVPVAGGEDLSPKAPVPLFEAPYDAAGVPYAGYAVDEQGNFIMVQSNEGQEASHLVVVVNWLEELEEKLPSSR